MIGTYAPNIQPPGIQPPGIQAVASPAARDRPPRRDPVSVGAAIYRDSVAADGRPGRRAYAGTGARPSDADLKARIGLLAEQLDLALSELALCRAKYRQACDDDGADAPWLRSELDQLALPRVAHALSAELAAVERFRLWAQELDGLHEQARTRSLLA